MLCSLQTVPYLTKRSANPTSGHRIVAAYTDENVIVYQVCSSQLADSYLDNGNLAAASSLPTKRLWLRPSFILSCYRCGWTTWPNKDRILAVTLTRSAFNSLLKEGEPSMRRNAFAVPKFDVQLQWTPERAPDGGCESWEAIQFGLKGDAAKRYVTGEGVVKVEDVTMFVRENRQKAAEMGWGALQVPDEKEYDGETLSVEEFPNGRDVQLSDSDREEYFFGDF
ncbi:hypothetical protein HDU93_000735 [Gonapodya sp. JEL0774]|nr:hypothetical protein HDU93_000735 [Gonapodya sp. JEL0774]